MGLTGDRNPALMYYTRVLLGWAPSYPPNIRYEPAEFSGSIDLSSLEYPNGDPLALHIPDDPGPPRPRPRLREHGLLPGLQRRVPPYGVERSDRAARPGSPDQLHRLDAGGGGPADRRRAPLRRSHCAEQTSTPPRITPGELVHEPRPQLQRDLQRLQQPRRLHDLPQPPVAHHRDGLVRAGDQSARGDDVAAARRGGPEGDLREPRRDPERAEAADSEAARGRAAPRRRVARSRSKGAREGDPREGTGEGQAEHDPVRLRKRGRQERQGNRDRARPAAVGAAGEVRRRVEAGREGDRSR